MDLTGYVVVFIVLIGVFLGVDFWYKNQASCRLKKEIHFTPQDFIPTHPLKKEKEFVLERPKIVPRMPSGGKPEVFKSSLITFRNAFGGLDVDLPSPGLENLDKVVNSLAREVREHFKARGVDSVDSSESENNFEFTEYVVQGVWDFDMKMENYTHSEREVSTEYSFFLLKQLLEDFNTYDERVRFIVEAEKSNAGLKERNRKKRELIDEENKNIKLYNEEALEKNLEIEYRNSNILRENKIREAEILKKNEEIREYNEGVLQDPKLRAAKIVSGIVTIVKHFVFRGRSSGL